MEAININHVEGQSNYRLLDKSAMPLMAKIEHHKMFVPSGDGWEYAVEEFQWNKPSRAHLQYIRVRGPRKQIAARRVRQIESATIEKKLTVQAKPVVMAILENKSEQDIEIARLEARIQELMGLLNR